jgi:hypothetical protein
METNGTYKGTYKEIDRNIRKRNGITATSSVNILAAENDFSIWLRYCNKIIVKIGHKLDLGNLLPPRLCCVGN